MTLIGVLVKWNNSSLSKPLRNRAEQPIRIAIVFDTELTNHGASLRVRNESHAAIGPVRGCGSTRDFPWSRRGRWRARIDGRTQQQNASQSPYRRCPVGHLPTTSVPGAVPLRILGRRPAAAAILAWRRHAVAPLLTFVVGGAAAHDWCRGILFVGYSNIAGIRGLGS